MNIFQWIPQVAALLKIGATLMGLCKFYNTAVTARHHSTALGEAGQWKAGHPGI
jgi:hypothetical protein